MNIEDSNGESRNRLAPYKLLGIPDISIPSLQANRGIYDYCLSDLAQNEQPLIPAWSMWEKACRIAQWEYLLANWDSCLEWALKAAEAALKCLQLTCHQPLPEDYGLEDDSFFAPYGIMVDEREKLRKRFWLDFYETGICWALVAGDFECARKIVQVEVESLPFDKNENLRRKFALATKKLVEGASSTELFQELATSHVLEPFYSELSKAVLAMSLNDSEKYSICFEKALRHHLRKGEFQPLGHEVPVFPVMANVIWHLAEQESFYPSLFPFIHRHLFVLPDEATEVTHRSTRITESIPKPKMPADLLGIVDYEYGGSIKRFVEIQEKIDRGAEVTLDLVNSKMSWSSDIAQDSYLRGEFEVCRKWCGTYCDSIFEYVELDSAYFQKSYWRPTMATGLAWAAVGQHWSKVDKLLGSIDEKLTAPEGGEAFRLYYLGLRAWWRDESELDWVVAAKKRKGANLLIAQLEAISARDGKGFSQAINKYMNGFLDRLRGDYEFPFEAILLWNIAQKRGIEPNVNARFVPYLFSLDWNS